PRSKSSTRRRPAAPSSARKRTLVSTVSMAPASSSGFLGLTRSPVRPASTTSGTAAARHATIGKPAAIASANTSPKPSWTVGKQKQSAPTYSTARAERVISPRNVTTPFRPRLVARFRRRTDSGPSPTMRTRRSGIREASRTAARSKSSSRLRGYMRATDSTVGGPGARDGTAAKRRRHAVARDRVDILRHARGVAAGHDHTLGTLDVDALPARLQREQGAHEPALVAQLVGDDALEHDRVAHAARAAARPFVAVEVDADDDVGVRRMPQERPVVTPAIQGMKAAARADLSQTRLVTQALETADDAVDGNPGPAAFCRARRRRAEELEPHRARAQRPWNFGGRFSRN